MIWRAHDKQTFTPIGMQASLKADKVIDKIAEQVEPIIDSMDGGRVG